jgi:hypothetical protein
MRPDNDTDIQKSTQIDDVIKDDFAIALHAIEEMNR